MPFHHLSSVQITPSADGFVTVRPTAFQIRVHISEKACVQAFLDSQLTKQSAVYILETRRAVIGHQPLVYVGVTGSIAAAALTISFPIRRARSTASSSSPCMRTF